MKQFLGVSRPLHQEVSAIVVILDVLHNSSSTIGCKVCEVMPI